MNLLFPSIVFTGLLFSTVVASGAIERVVEKTFTVGASGTLRVETHGGPIRVVPGKGAEVHIVARQTIRAASEQEADELLQKLNLNMVQSGNEVSVTSRYEQQRPSSWFRIGSWPPVSVSIEVTVPEGFAADLRTSGGGIKVGNLQGAVVARTSGGAISLGMMGGPVEARTSGGGISLEGAGGPVDLQTSGGSISAGRVRGTARLSTSGGNIRLDAAEGAVKASTSGGNIRAALTGPLSDESSLTTSGGNVNVLVGPSAAFSLDASASGGGVDVDGVALTLTKSSRSKLSGTVNGGGPLLKLRTSGGGVVVRAL